jgi:hypothetical protein
MLGTFPRSESRHEIEPHGISDHVLTRRLHALFNPNAGHPGGSSDSRQGDMRYSKSEPITKTCKPLDSIATEVIQRDAIKVLVITWNMGDASVRFIYNLAYLKPKGDLSVLLGNIPPYTSSAATSSLPQLPVENAHPYHLVVIAGQECPTHSGMPRGVGGGLMKGVHVRPSHRKDKDKKEEGLVPGPQSVESGIVSRSPIQGEEEDHVGPRPSSPIPYMPQTPSARATASSTTKGWSTMLDGELTSCTS